jgi:hypothetical protein
MFEAWKREGSFMAGSDYGKKRFKKKEEKSGDVV